MSTSTRDTGGREPAHGRWEIAGLIALATIVVVIPLSRFLPARSGATPELAEEKPTFVGSATCKDCHETLYDRWRGSDHDLAMAEATDETVLGDFDDAVYDDGRVTTRFYRRDGRFLVHTEGPGGEMAEFEITHTFGHDPLQQYLVPFPGGRLQTLNVTWDVPRQRWFRQYPDRDIPADDWLHWTRNGQNWNGMCAECHSTNLRKGYDPETDTYDTTWSDIDVGCEACHGPGSRHVAWAQIAPMARPALPDEGLAASTSRISPRAMVELCAPCHSRRSELGDYDHTGTELLDHMLPALLREELYEPDGQIRDEVYVYGSFLQSKMYAREVSCPDCHDSHSLQLHREGNNLCLQCHESHVYDDAAHHFHKKIHEGMPSEGARCVRCHMVERPYMVIDWRTDHSFRVPRPDLTEEIGTPNACTQSGCHDDRPLTWSIEAYRKWYGEARRPHFGTTFAAARAGDTGTAAELVRLSNDELQPPIVRATALELLARNPAPEAGDTIRRALASGEALLRRTAAAHVTIGTPEDLEPILPLLSDPVRAVRMAAVSRLAGAPQELLEPYQREALRKGIEEYRESMAHSLDFASAGMNLGNLESSLGDPERAEKYYRTALTVDDLFFPAKMNLAVLLSARGRNGEAETLLREVLRDYPDNSDASYSLGLLLVETGEIDEALVWLDRAAEANPLRSRVHYNLGLLFQQSGRMAEAERSLSRALELEPEMLDYLHAYADHLMRTERHDEALAVADRIIELYPDAPVGHRLKSILQR
jgi:tetratricopeptide (TPR) repeat protein